MHTSHQAQHALDICHIPNVRPRQIAIRGSNEDFTITEKASTRAFSWLKAPTSAFTFWTLLRHYALALAHSKYT